MAFFAKRFFAQRFFAKRYWSSGEGVPGQLAGENANTAQGLLKPAIAVDLLGLVATTAYGELTPDIGAGGDVTQALTGLAGTGAQGALLPHIEVDLVGQPATTAQGTLGTNVDGSASIALTGLGVVATPGLLLVAIDVELVGQSTATAQGGLTPDLAVIVALTGLGVSGTGGLLGVDLACALTGLRVTLVPGRINDYGRAPGQHDIWARSAVASMFAATAVEEDALAPVTPSLVSTQPQLDFTVALPYIDAETRSENIELYSTTAQEQMWWTEAGVELVVATTLVTLFVVEPEAQLEVDALVDELIAA